MKSSWHTLQKFQTLDKGEGLGRNWPEAMESFRHLVSSPIFLSSVTARFFAQFIKDSDFCFEVQVRTPKRDLLLNLLWSTGGCRSSHSAEVVRACGSCRLKVGFCLLPFHGLSVFFSFVAVRDASGLRRTPEVEEGALNPVVVDLEWNDEKTNHSQ